MQDKSNAKPTNSDDNKSHKDELIAKQNYECDFCSRIYENCQNC